MMSGKLYICITPFFPTLDSFRGPFVYDQVRAIERNTDYKVVVFVPKPYGKKIDDYEYEGVKVHYFDNINTPSYILHGIFNDINARLFLKRIKQLSLNVNDIYVAHGHTGQFALYALVLKTLNPKIITVVQHHDPDPYTIRNGVWARKVWNAKYRAQKNIRLFEKIDLHLCISEFVRNSLFSFPNVPENLYFLDYANALNSVRGLKRPEIKDSYILYNGVDLQKFHKIEKLRNRRCFTIGSIGNFIDWKDHITLIKAVNELINRGISDIKVVLIGSGTKYGEYIQYISDYKLDKYIEIRKEVHHSQLAEFYNSIDLYVQPSYFEGFGCVCTEAAACGVPFMICKHQGAAEYISSNNGIWLFEPHDYVTLAKNILYYKKYKPKQEYVHSYNIDVLIKKYIGYINERVL